MDIHSVLNYFLDYEKEIKFQQSSLQDVKGYDYSIEVLGDPGRIEQDILQRKLSHLLKKIEGKRKQITRRPGYEDDNVFKETIQKSILQQDSDLLLASLEFKKIYHQREILKEFQELAGDDSCQICYPLLEKGKYRHPLFVFESTLHRGILTIEHIHVNLNALIIFVASLTDNHITEVEEMYKEEIQLILKGIQNINASATIVEGLDSAIAVIEGQLPAISFSIPKFKKTNGWSCLSTTFITTETLNEVQEAPFYNEIQLVKQKMKAKSKENKTNKPASALQSYLVGTQAVQPFEEIRNRNYFHYGSYTDQYSVNEKQWYVLGALDETNLLSVNGPPGTGKTALLKEIIADELVKKAKKLIDFWDQKWKKEGKIYVSPMKGENNHSILVTSTNNKAVDNIGEELLEEISYFNHLVEVEDDSNKSLKGLMCARMGNMKNVNQFRRQVLEPLLEYLKTDEAEGCGRSEQEVVSQFNQMMDDMTQIQKKVNKYQLLLKACNKQVPVQQGGTEDKQEKEIEELESIINRIETDNKEINKQIVEKEAALRQYKNTRGCVEKHIFEIQENEKDLYRTLELYRDYSRKKWQIFSSKRKRFFKQYPSELYITDHMKKIEDKQAVKLNQLEQLTNNIQAIERKIQILTNRLNIDSQKKTELEKRKDKKLSDLELLKRKKRAKIDLMEDLQVDSLSEKAGLGNYEILHQNNSVRLKRNQLFKQALLICEYYIWKHREPIIHNLEYISSENYLFQPYYSETQDFTARREAAIRASWETLFLCFPVVTTTLHSFKAPTFHMLENLFDLLLVDEAGQVLPQYLVGPLYRTKRALIVGDVMQIEPVRPIGDKVINQSEIPEEEWGLFDITKNSAQHYADLNSGIFEMMGTQQVGIILEEHRRCEAAIVSFSNQYVYGNRLTIIKKDDDKKLFGNNLIGIDVRGIQTAQNINKQEAIICKQIIEKMVRRYGEEVRKDIGIITPFRNQKTYLEKLIKGVTAGTVHTFQGQEKRYILFSSVVNQRSINFVGGQSNLINVATTRAKEQFIFVGNFKTAQDSKGYLEKLLKSIMKHGAPYSIYDTELMNKMPEHQINEVFQLFGSDQLQQSSAFGKYLYNNFPESIITGAQINFDTLLHALHKAEKSIDIISPWLNPNLIMDRFFKGLDKFALKNNVNVQILFGYHANKKTSLNNISSIYEVDADERYTNKKEYINAVNNLKRVLQGGLKYAPPLHVKLLLVDRKYLIIGSHNWLSNTGESKNSKEEISVILSDKGYIDYVVEYFKLDEQKKVYN